MISEVKSMSPGEWFLLVVLSVLWGGSFFFVGKAVEALPPLNIVAIRVTLAAIVLGACPRIEKATYNHYQNLFSFGSISSKTGYV